MASITKKTDNSLLGRQEVELLVQFQGATMSNDAARKEVATTMSVDEKLVKVKNIYTAFGKQEASVHAFVYADDKSRDMVEVRKKKPKKAKAEKTEAKEKK
ncbi:hypothetical protein J4207_02910 [Candidatus Woesearchaeota archaeon]|nr:hypothetical protein [Candidatus Woesearchaeota archaeon]